jgi:hypothetical protein
LDKKNNILYGFIDGLFTVMGPDIEVDLGTIPQGVNIGEGIDEIP